MSAINVLCKGRERVSRSETRFEKKKGMPISTVETCLTAALRKNSHLSHPCQLSLSLSLSRDFVIHFKLWLPPSLLLTRAQKKNTERS